MRKHLLLPSLLAIGLLGLGAGLASACDGKAKTSSASAAGCASKTQASTASTAAADCSAACMAACTAAKTAGAEGHCAGAASVQTAGAGGHCNGAATKTAAGGACAAQGDFFISSYMKLSKASAGHCGMSAQTAAAEWRQGLETMIAGAEAGAQRESLQALAGQLADWPADAAAAKARFSAVSEWTAGYCERFPERTAGAKVVTCAETGTRWVELEAAAADSQS